MFKSLAIWYLRKCKASVLIGYDLDGNKIRCLYNDAYIYDNSIGDIDYLCKDGSRFEIPEGKFKENVKPVGGNLK